MVHWPGVSHISCQLCTYCKSFCMGESTHTFLKLQSLSAKMSREAPSLRRSLRVIGSASSIATPEDTRRCTDSLPPCWSNSSVTSILISSSPARITIRARSGSRSHRSSAWSRWSSSPWSCSTSTPGSTWSSGQHPPSSAGRSRTKYTHVWWLSSSSMPWRPSLSAREHSRSLWTARKVKGYTKNCWYSLKKIFLVWSKLESGGAPQPVTLVNLVREKLKEQSNKISEQVEMDLRDQL